MNKTNLFTLLLIVFSGPHALCGSQSAARSAAQRAVPRIDGNIQANKLIEQQDIVVIREEVLVEEFSPVGIDAELLNDGKVFLAWRIHTPADEWVGEGILFTPSLQKYGGTIYYAREVSSRQEVKEFSDGNILVIYGKKFVVINQGGDILCEPTLIEDDNTTDVSSTVLSGGRTALIAYQRLVGAHGSGRYIIINSSGKIIYGPETFSDGGKTNYISATTLPNGLINIAYNCSGSKTKVIDVFNNTIVSEHKFHAKQINGIKSLVLNNRNILLVYINEDSKGQCMVIKSSGQKVSGPLQFYDEDIKYHKLTKRADGNVCIVFTDQNNFARCVIVDTSGKVIKGPVQICTDYKIENEHFDCVHLRDNMIMVPFSGRKNGVSDYTGRMGGYVVIK